MNEIINKYKAGEITVDEANEKLREAGAGYYLKPLTEEERAAKKEREDIAGFFEVPEGQRKPTYPQKPDMGRNKDLAGFTVVQKTVAGLFAVEYDEDGYAVKAVRI